MNLFKKSMLLLALIGLLLPISSFAGTLDPPDDAFNGVQPSPTVNNLNRATGQEVWVPVGYICYNFIDLDGDGVETCEDSVVTTTKVFFRNLDRNNQVEITSIKLYGPDGLEKEELLDLDDNGSVDPNSEYISLAGFASDGISIKPVKIKNTTPFSIIGGRPSLFDIIGGRPFLLVKWQAVTSVIAPRIGSLIIKHENSTGMLIDIHSATVQVLSETH